jgi:hypothetical protein
MSRICPQQMSWGFNRVLRRLPQPSPQIVSSAQMRRPKRHIPDLNLLLPMLEVEDMAMGFASVAPEGSRWPTRGGPPGSQLGRVRRGGLFRYRAASSRRLARTPCRAAADPTVIAINETDDAAPICFTLVNLIEYLSGFEVHCRVSGRITGMRIENADFATNVSTPV